MVNLKSKPWKSLFGSYLLDWRPPEPIRGSRVDCSSSWAPSSSTALKILPIPVLQYYLVCQKKILYVPMSKKKKTIPRHPTASGHVLQYASQLAFLTVLTHNPLSSIPNYMHHACNSTYFLRGAAVHTASEKKKYTVSNATSFFKRMSSVNEDVFSKWQRWQPAMSTKAQWASRIGASFMFFCSG